MNEIELINKIMKEFGMILYDKTVDVIMNKISDRVMELILEKWENGTLSHKCFIKKTINTLCEFTSQDLNDKKYIICSIINKKLTFDGADINDDKRQEYYSLDRGMEIVKLLSIKQMKLLASKLNNEEIKSEEVLTSDIILLEEYKLVVEDGGTYWDGGKNMNSMMLTATGKMIAEIYQASKNFNKDIFGSRLATSQFSNK